MKKVYLAGPIGGLTYDHAAQWRDYATLCFEQFGIHAYSPLRYKQFLREHGVLTTHPYTSNPLATARGILTRDHWDCMTADLIFVNFLGATTISMGTVMEVAFGHAYRKPIVAAMELGNIHEHAMVSEAIDFRLDSLEQAVDIATSILNP
jgi:nucleoside 2-deoxyribosyltransferase